MIVDIHAHLTPDLYLTRSKTLGGSYQNRFTGFPESTTLDERFEMMDEAEVGLQVLSPTCAPYTHDAAQAVEAARLLNDRYAALRRDHPDRLRFWGSLPLPHISESLAEIARSLDELDAEGVVLGCFCLDESIAHERFEPLFAELDRRGALVFLHPCQNGIGSPHINAWELTGCAGASLEDSVAVMHLIARGIPLRYSRLRFIVPHFGGILPMLLDRLDGQMPRADLAEAPSITARRFHYDTVGWGSRAALLAAVEAFGAQQIVTGSDFPILLPKQSYRQSIDAIRDSGLPADVIEHILGNAERLLAERR